MQISDLKNRKVCIYGTGSRGIQVYYRLNFELDIKCFYQTSEVKKTSSYILGIPVKSWKSKTDGEFIIIASEYWREILPNLVDAELKPFKDFVLWDFLTEEIDTYLLIDRMRKAVPAIVFDDESFFYYKGKRKLAVFHGSCHTRVLGQLCNMNSQFSNEYQVINVPKTWAYSYEKTKSLVVNYVSDDIFLKQIDLFIYEQVTEQVIDYKDFWFDNLKEKLRKDCKIVSTPYLQFSGYFPQVEIEERTNIWMYRPWYKDIYVYNLIREGLNDKEILEVISKDDFLSPKEIEKAYDEGLISLQESECELDVKMFDYIYEHGREEQLFYSIEHPNRKVMVEWANRILAFLYPFGEIDLNEQYEKEDFILKTSTLKTRDYPVYSSVVKQLGLQRYEKRFIMCKGSGFNELLTFDEYMRILIQNERERIERE